MSGTDERRSSTHPGDRDDGSGEGADRGVKEYRCVGRIARIPLIVSTSSAVSSFYSSVKRSNGAVETVFDNVEDGWSKGAEIVAPFTSKIEAKLERPLRAIDSAACVGLDFVEGKISSVKLPADEIYERSRDYVARNVFAPAAHFTATIVENFRGRVSRRCNADESAPTSGSKNIAVERSGDKEAVKSQK